MKKKGTTILLIIVFLAGLSLLLYPTVSDYWNSFHASRAVAFALWAPSICSIPAQAIMDLDSQASTKERTQLMSR